MRHHCASTGVRAGESMGERVCVCVRVRERNVRERGMRKGKRKEGYEGENVTF